MQPRKGLINFFVAQGFGGRHGSKLQIFVHRNTTDDTTLLWNKLQTQASYFVSRLVVNRCAGKLYRTRFRTQGARKRLEQGRLATGVGADDHREGVVGDLDGQPLGDDALVVSYRALTENRDGVADLLNAALTKPRFDPDRVQLVRSQVELVIRSEDTDPSAIATKAMAKMMWGDHPYGTSLNGTLESVDALTRDDLVAAKDRVIAKDKVIVAASGDINAQELGALVDRVLDGIAEKGAPAPVPATYQLQGGQTVIPWDSPQTVVQFAQPGPPMSDPDYFAAVVANHILGGGGFSSRLMDEIREKRGLTYGVGTSLANGLYGDSWQGGMASANDKVAEAGTLVRDIWGKFKDGITDKELNDAKTYITGEYPLRFDGNGRIASILAGMQLIGLPADYVNTRNAKVEAVTKEDVQRVVQKYLDPAKLHFVLVGQPVGLDAPAAPDAPATPAAA